MLTCAFRDKKLQCKPVVLLTTTHKTCMKEKQVCGKMVIQQSMVYGYNQYISNKMMCHYASKQPTRRY
ncbi:hypothetical protein RRG08_026137 [Elysia crispata]|uniref:Uncharacterized protein n=1 Tax=Elysia crispata TaxID=231223 RepID=A0AAE1ASF0_9GAST|nr:hypothetical protein RRG08_026137 [Elysia crispata]